MIGDKVLDAAVAQGIIDASQAARLRDLARASTSPAAREEPHADPDDEKFRLIGGFNDVFVTIGVLLLISALSALSRVIDFDLGFSVIALLSAWGLAEFFSRRMRLGLGVFAAALRVDASDPQRRTRRADVAFWLHMLAAPMVVHALVPLVTGGVGGIGTAQAITILVVFVLLGLVALVIDRRALLVSGLSYAGVAIAYLLSQSVEEGFGMSLTLFGLAVVVLGLSAGWRSLRRAVLPLLPLDRLRVYIPLAT